ncbi:type I restriction enzyme S subunit [Flavobacterium sp. CG_9.10]|uniref:restriction endonuclease subunit S n=1 Tax=Flavobacterium sp. CG_9.10 TaxID=2787729 RepID=UPI0018CA5154|nr:restriction endonuclease subunit S [Flavobacterium sp. CG_9.10]MBG6110796.1 type I restriction enzyme S subunit [Flavobacterium sp. CG_9.10]
MKQGWEIKKLGEVLVKTETVDPTKKPNAEFTYLDVSSVNKETKQIENATVLMGKDAPSRARKLVRTDDVIFATVRPTHSRVALITEDYDEQVCSTGYFVLRGKDFIFNQYLFYFLLTDEFNEQMEKLQKGASYPAVTDTEVKSILLRYPKSFPEQQRIVAILDEAFAAIAKAKANAQQNLKNAKELFESYLQAVFENKCEGWEENTLGSVCEISSKLIDPKKLEFQDLVHIGAGNIITQKGTLIDLKTAKEENLISGKFLFDEQMILYSKIRPYLMKVVNCDFQGLCSADIYPLLPFTEKMSKDFLYHLLLSKDFTEYAILGSQRAGMPKVNREHLFAYKFYLPSLIEQQTIVQKLDALNAETKKLEAIYQQKINDLEELKKSVLQKAFAGELKNKAEVKKQLSDVNV